MIEGSGSSGVVGVCRTGVLRRAVLCGLFLQLAATAYGFKLSPMVQVLEPSGRGASAVFHVESDSDQQVTVEISMAKRVVDGDGKESTLPEEDNFSVYPSQILLEPKKTQAVRVRWLGDARPKSELAYRIIAEQLPVSLTKEDRGARINLVVRYIGSVYVVPKGVKADVVLEAVSEEAGGESGRKLAIVLRNQGTAHALLDNLEVDVTANGGEGDGRTSVHLTQAGLKGIDSENILAGHTRRFVIPWPQGLGRGPLELKFKFDQPK